MSAPAKSRRAWVIWAFAGVIFLSGLGVGAGLTYLRIGNMLYDMAHDPDELPERMASRAAEELDLDEREEKRLRKIFRKRHERVISVREETLARVSPELDDLDAEVAELLGPEKAKRWSKRWDDKRRRWGPRKRRE